MIHIAQRLVKIGTYLQSWNTGCKVFQILRAEIRTARGPKQRL